MFQQSSVTVSPMKTRKAASSRRRTETFNAVQRNLLWSTAQSVYETKFVGRERPQVKMALALGIAQTSVSALLHRRYTPSVQVAEQIAHLAGLESLRDLVGEYYVRSPGRDLTVESFGSFHNLHECVLEHGVSAWPAWVIAAAKAGAFADDVSASHWKRRLDSLSEKMPKR